MTKALITESILGDIADSIRAKLGVETTYKPSDMSGAIDSISTAGTMQSKTVTPSASQQVVQPDTGYDGLSSVTVNGDADLVAGNIKKDVEIFGVTGSYEGSGGGSTSVELAVSVTGGYNGGATVNVSVDGLSKFTATGSSPYNAAYTPSSGSFAYLGKTFGVEINNPQSNTSPFSVVVTVEESEYTFGPISSKGADNSYGYEYSDTKTVTVHTGGAVTEVYVEPSSGDMSDGEVQILIANYSETTLETKPTCQTPTAGIAGQNSSSAINALNASGTYTGSSYNWTTNDRNYSGLWIGADYGEAVVLNALVVAARTFGNNRQIYSVIAEGSNDGSSWTTLGTASTKGNDIPSTGWFKYGFGNTTAYRYYRLRTETNSGGTVNGSVTFTIYGLGFLYEDASVPTKAFYKKSGTLYKFAAYE